MTSGQEFGERAYVINQFEIESSTLALEQAESEEVKAFAQRMIDEHTEAGTRLATAAQGQGVTLPTDLDEAYGAKLEALSGLEGSAFDEAYVDAQITAHEEAISVFEGYRAAQDETDLNFFASEMIEGLEMHLEEARALDSGA